MQGNQPVAKYITKFDEFLVRCDENESDIVALFRFRSRLKENLRSELFVRDISTLEQTYQLVQDLDHSHSFSFTRHRLKNNTNKTTTVKSQSSQSQSRFGSSNCTQIHDDKNILQ